MKTATIDDPAFPFCTPWGLWVLSLVIVAHDEITRGILRQLAEDLRRGKQRDNTSKKKQQRRKRRK